MANSDRKNKFITSHSAAHKTFLSLISKLFEFHLITVTVQPRG